MFKMPQPRNDHYQPILHAILDRILIPDRPAGLNKCRHPRRMRDLNAVIKREKRITGKNRALQIKIELARFGNSLTHRVDPAGLTATLTYQLPVPDQGNSV